MDTGFRPSNLLYKKYDNYTQNIEVDYRSRSSNSNTYEPVIAQKRIPFQEKQKPNYDKQTPKYDVRFE